jgi:hypothetical protein
VESYPLQYRDIASAILNLSGGRLGVKVDYGVARLAADRNKIRQLNIGPVSYTQLVQGACDEGYAEQGKLGDRQWIMLLEAVVSSCHTTLLETQTRFITSFFLTPSPFIIDK